MDADSILSGFIGSFLGMAAGFLAAAVPLTPHTSSCLPALPTGRQARAEIWGMAVWCVRWCHPPASASPPTTA